MKNIGKYVYLFIIQNIWILFNFFANFYFLVEVCSTAASLGLETEVDIQYSKIGEKGQ